MDHELAANRYAARQHRNEPAQRIDIAGILGAGEYRTDAGLEFLHRQAGVDDQGAVGIGLQPRRRGGLVLFLDLADDLLDQILDGDQPVDAAIFVDHQRHVDAPLAHLQKQVEHPHAGRDEHHGADQFA